MIRHNSLGISLMLQIKPSQKVKSMNKGLMASTSTLDTREPCQKHSAVLNVYSTTCVNRVKVPPSWIVA